MTEQPLIQYDLLILCNLRSAEIGGATYDSLTVKLLKSSSYTLLCGMKKNYVLILTSICNKQNSSTSSTYIYYFRHRTKIIFDLFFCEKYGYLEIPFIDLKYLSQQLESA